MLKYLNAKDADINLAMKSIEKMKDKFGFEGDFTKPKNMISRHGIYKYVAWLLKNNNAKLVFHLLFKIKHKVGSCDYESIIILFEGLDSEFSIRVSEYHVLIDALNMNAPSVVEGNFLSPKDYILFNSMELMEAIGDTVGNISHMKYQGLNSLIINRCKPTKETLTLHEMQERLDQLKLLDFDFYAEIQDKHESYAWYLNRH